MTAALMGAALFVGSQAVAVAATAEPAPAPTLSAPSAAGDQLGSDTLSSVTATTLCVFYTEGDYVHVSSTAFEASGHGWWVNGNCDATWAVVTVQLQEYYSDGSWRNKGTVGKATVRSGGGSGNRATGRAGCNNASVTGWRSVVDVDLVGLADDPGKLHTTGRNIGCRRL